MSQYSPEILNEIRRSDALVLLLEEAGFPTNRAGADLRGDCPFEGTRSNSESKFHVQMREGASPGWRYTCYGCGESGDVFRLVSRLRGAESFLEQVRQAAALAGIALPQIAPSRNAVARGRTATVLGGLATLSREHALAREDRLFAGVDLDPLVTSGEVGFLPDHAAVRAHLAIAKVDATALRAIGGPGALRAMCGRWVVWGLDSEGRVTVGRALSETPGPLPGDTAVLADAGAGKAGWIMPDGAANSARSLRERWYGIVLDDALYLSLRSHGVLPLALPVSAASVEATARPPVDGSSPVLLLAPEDAARIRARAAAVRLLPVAPRIRMAEVSPAPAPGTSVDSWREMLRRGVDTSEVLLDWSTRFILQRGDLTNDRGRRQAALALADIVTSTRSPLERVVYADEVRALTGIDVETGGSRGGRKSAASTGPVR
jgi:hypothetical protein